MLERASSGNYRFDDAPLVTRYVLIALGTPLEGREHRPPIDSFHSLQVRAPRDRPGEFPFADAFSGGMTERPVGPPCQGDWVTVWSAKGPGRFLPVPSHGVYFLLD